MITVTIFTNDTESTHEFGSLDLAAHFVRDRAAWRLDTGKLSEDDYEVIEEDLSQFGTTPSDAQGLPWTFETQNVTFKIEAF